MRTHIHTCSSTQLNIVFECFVNLWAEWFNKNRQLKNQGIITHTHIIDTMSSNTSCSSAHLAHTDINKNVPAYMTNDIMTR